MMKVGLILVGAAAGMLALLALLSWVGLSRFGPCGPDPLGLFLLLGFLLTGGAGFLFLLVGALTLVGDRIHDRFRPNADI